MPDTGNFETYFKEAVAAIDAGDEAALQGMLENHPMLVRDRLHSPGPWLREKIGDALDGFFKDPYLLWFVAEDPVRNNILPPNIASITDVIIRVAKRESVSNLQEQLDYALRLVAWSWVAAACKQHLPLIDVLVNAGASPNAADDALVNGHLEAAAYLVKRGATLTLSTALSLGYWEEATELMTSAGPEQKQSALVLCALRGNTEAIRRLIEAGIDINKPSPHLYSHASPLHHAVCSKSLDAVKLFVEAGADLNAKDTVYHGTPLGWAEYGESPEIEHYLRDKQAN